MAQRSTRARTHLIVESNKNIEKQGQGARCDAGIIGKQVKLRELVTVCGESVCHCESGKADRGL